MRLAANARGTKPGLNAISIGLAAILLASCSKEPPTPFVLPPSPGLPVQYADLVELTQQAPVILRGQIIAAKRLKGDDAADNPPPGLRRLVTLRVSAALKATDLTPQDIKYLVDWVPADGGDEAPPLRGAEVIVFLTPSQTRDDFYSLIERSGQVGATPKTETEIRDIMKDMQVPHVSSLSVTGVAGTFDWGDRVQFLLDSADRQRLSLDSRPDGALTLVFDEAAGDQAEVQPRTLLWYKLACSLAPKLPPAVVRDYATKTFRPAQAYSALLEKLGPCR